MNPFSSGTRLRDMIRAIRACKTAAEERAVVRKECASIRAAVSDNDNDYRHRNLAKLMFIHMLGYPTHFGQMECLKLIAAPGFPEKRIGYLGLMLLLDERQEVLMLVTNSLKQDLNHTNQYIVGLALCALGNISSSEMARDLAPEVERLLQFRDPNIRKKAALCSIRIIKKVPDLAENFVNPAASLLKEKHHGVLLTGIQLCTDLCKISTEALEYFRKKCTDGLVKILKDVVNSPYAPEYDIAGIADPFLHIRLLRLLSVLGHGDADASDCMNDILAQVATKTESNKNAGNAVLYECVDTIMSIEDNSGLRVLAINILGRFLSNRDNNIRYVALNMLMRAITVDSQAVQRHRATILECVKDSDASIRKKALELIYLLVNENNVMSLSKELINYLEVSDPEFKGDLTAKICSLVEKFSPEKIWYIDQMLKVLYEDEIEAPMWVDLSSEVTGTSHENDDEWFLMTHQYHQCSSRKLISAFSRGEFSTNFVSEIHESCSPKLLPPSVSKSRGKHYKSREWAHNSCTFTTKKHSVKTISSKLSQVTSGDVKKIKHQLGDEILKKCGLLPAGVDCEKTVNEAAGSSTSRMNTSFCYSKTDSGLTPSREGEKNSISTVTSESTEQNEKSYEVSRQTKGQSSKLLSSLRISLRKSCVTRPAARMDINRVRKSVDPKSSSSQSSVGSSSHSGHKSNNMTPRGMQHNDTTPFSGNAIGISQVPKNILKGPSILKASPVLRYVTSISGQKIESDVHKSVNQETSKAKVRNFLVHPQVSLPLRMQKQDRLIASRAKGKVQVSEQYKRFTGAGKENMAEQTTKSVNLLAKPKVSGVMAQVQNASDGRLPVKKDVAKQKNISCRSGLQTSANMVKKVYLR